MVIRWLDKEVRLVFCFFVIVEGLFLLLIINMFCDFFYFILFRMVCNEWNKKIIDDFNVLMIY